MPGRDSKRNQRGTYNNNHGQSNGRGGGAPRNHVIPSEPPFTAYIGNAPDTMVQGDFENQLFVGLKVKQVRLVRDRQTDRFRGFGYVDFEDADSLRRAIELDGTCVNDRPIRIDVAVRPLGTNQSEGFRKQPDFEPRGGHRHPSGYNNNRSNDRFRPGGRRNNYNQQETSQNVHEEIDYRNAPNNEQSNGSSNSGRNNERQHNANKTQSTLNDDVFHALDTPASNDDNTEQTNNTDQSTTMNRQQSRNWADCPIDESTVEPSPPASANNTFVFDDFQVVRNKNYKSRANQQSSARSTGPQYGRNRDGNGNQYHRGGSSQMGGGRNYHDPSSSQHSNHSQQFNQPQASFYHTDNNANRHPPSSGSRNRLDSNRSNSSRNYSGDHTIERNRSGASESSSDINNNPISSADRPRLKLLPRSQNVSSATVDNQAEDASKRNASIFGCGKPRDERDPKLAQLDKHIDEVVEKEQHLADEQSPPSNGSTNVITKPVRILTAEKNR